MAFIAIGTKIAEFFLLNKQRLIISVNFRAMKLMNIFCGFAFFAFTACSTQSMLTSNVSSTKIDTLLLLKPVTSISVILHGDKPFHDPVLSGWSLINLKNGVVDYLPKKVSLFNADFDSITQNRINDEISNLARLVEHQNGIKNVPFPTAIDSVMKILKIDYALCVYQNGFSRTTDNYFSELGRSYYKLERSYGWDYSRPVKSGSTVIGYILDRKNKNIALYRRDTRDNWEPVDKNHSDKQLQHIFQRYFRDVE
jgi:hypothetical protein